MRNRKKIAIAYLISLGIILIYILLPQKIPKTPRGIYQQENRIENDYLIIGFLPHWNYSKLSDKAVDSITHIAYFSLKVQGSGTIQKLTSPITEEPGYTTYKKLIKTTTQKPLILVISQANNEEISKLLGNINYQQQAINEIKEIATNINLSGINIDIEPSGGIPPSQRQSFTNFMKNLDNQLKSINPDITLSIDIYPTAAIKQRIWDLEKLENSVNYFIVMTYDYHQRSTSYAGPNSPLRGTPLSFDEDIIKNLAEITSIIPPQKIILGIPFYGYEWATTTADKYSQTTSGAVASLQRIRELLQEKDLEIQWDRNSLTPYIVHEEDGETKQIYFDNAESIALKIDLVKQANLGGIAIWALGYEQQNDPVWQSIRELN